MRIFFALLIFPAITFCQITYTGKVIDKKTKTAIPFATVGLVKENVGINADEQGEFHLMSHKQILDDTLIFSCVGYESLRIPVAKFSAATQIELIERIKNLKEVLIAGKRTWKYSILNEFSGCGHITETTNGSVTQTAQHFAAPVKNSILTEVKICAENKFSFFKRAIFRIRVYDMDSITKAPSNDLVDSVIEVHSVGRTETVNLEKYNIHVPNKDFFVAVEWMKVPFNAERSESKAVGDTLYKPHIGFDESKNLNGNGVWELLHSGQWIADPFIENLRIEATIKH